MYQPKKSQPSIYRSSSKLDHIFMKTNLYFASLPARLSRAIIISLSNAEDAIPIFLQLAQKA